MTLYVQCEILPYMFEWDEDKNRRNITKHGVSFEEAQVIWADPNSLEFLDPENSKDESRFIRVGTNIRRGILFVVFCERDDGDLIRIISARKATKNEREEYERGI